MKMVMAGVMILFVWPGAEAGVAAGGEKGAEVASAKASAQTTAGEKKASFDIPIWHPDARWGNQTVALMGSGEFGNYDGPAMDIMNTVPPVDPKARLQHYMATGGPYGLISCDPELNRYHSVTCNARGSEIDGPFSRARLIGGWGYMDDPRCAMSPDGRYFYVAEMRSTKGIRRFDLATQRVTTIPGYGWGTAIVPNSKGSIYFITKDGTVKRGDVDGKVEKTFKLQIPPEHTTSDWLLDEPNDRLYWSMGGCNRKSETQKWFVGYFDMKTEDGIFHGVLPANAKKPNCWMKAVPGPFDDFFCYTQVYISFGPDDPEHNFIYMGACDTYTFFRLDLKKREVWACSREKAGIRFVYDHPANMKPPLTGLYGQDINGSQRFWVDRRFLVNPRIK